MCTFQQVRSRAWRVGGAMQSDCACMYLCLLAIFVVKVKGEANGMPPIERGGVKVLLLLVHPLNKLLKNTGREKKIIDHPAQWL